MEVNGQLLSGPYHTPADAEDGRQLMSEEYTHAHFRPTSEEELRQEMRDAEDWEFIRLQN